MKDEHVKDAAQGVADDVPQDVAQDLVFDRGSGGARPPRHATTTAAAVFVQLAALAEMGAQLGSSVAFGSGCGQQALPGVPSKAPLCSLGACPLHLN